MASVKGHLCGHLDWSWLEFAGPDKNDTYDFEGNHKGDKSVYQQTSRRYTNGLEEILAIITNKLTSRGLFQRIQDSNKEDLLIQDLASNEDEDVIVITSVEHIYHNLVLFNPAKREWEVDISSGMQFIHPDLNMKMLTNLLVTFSGNNDEDGSLISKMTNPTANHLRIKFVQGIKVSPNTESGLKPFHVYASSTLIGTVNKRKTKIPRFDGVQISFENEEHICQCVAIMSVTDLTTSKSRFLLVITILEEILPKVPIIPGEPKPPKVVSKTAIDAFWDFPLYMYKKQPRYLNFEVRMVDAFSISKPCMLLPCPSRKKGFNSPWRPELSPKIRIYVVKYDKVDRKKMKK